MTLLELVMLCKLLDKYAKTYLVMRGAANQVFNAAWEEAKNKDGVTAEEFKALAVGRLAERLLSKDSSAATGAGEKEG